MVFFMANEIFNQKLRVGEATPPRRRRNRRNSIRVVDPDNVSIDERKAEEAWTEMLASINQKRPLTGILTGVETWNNIPCGVVIYEGIKVLIPANEFFTTMPESPDNEADPTSPAYLERIRSILYHRLGSKIEFVGTHFANQSDQLVAGSRKQALERKAARTFLAKRRNSDEYVINEGDVVHAQIDSSLSFGVIVEVGGVDCMITSDEISYFRVFDSSQNFANGDDVMVKLLEINRENPRNIKIRASIKQAKPNPFENAKKILQTSAQSSDARYIGTVAYVDKKAVYVNLTTSNLQVRCFFPSDKPIPQVGRKVFLRIREINSERNFINGEIIHIA